MKQTADTRMAIQDALKLFCSGTLFEAGIHLFSSLGYDTSLQAPLESKTFTEFKETYIDTSQNKDRFSEERALCSEWKSIDILFQLTDESFGGQGKLFDSKVNPLNPQSYLCFAVELGGSEYSKTKIASITREINKLLPIPILVIFKYGEGEDCLVTLSVINRRVNKKDSERDVLEKVTLIKDIRAGNPHRAHVEILADMSLPSLAANYEIHNFESLHKAWSEVLDTQALNKRFYNELSNWYFWAVKTVVYPGYEMEADKSGLFSEGDKIREHNAKNLIRLLTRLLFVWFIKEKDLIPEELFDEKQIVRIITKFSPSQGENSGSAESSSIYYKAVLQNLFFASLNAEQGKRAFRIDGQNQNATSLMRYKRYHKDPDGFIRLIEAKVPFMNGGLFECLDHQSDSEKGRLGGAKIIYEDGFSDRKDNELFVPDYIFFGKDVKVDLSSEYDDKKKKDVTVSGIVNILQKYKFTIAENTPVEEDIALDPELLGRVFENLLASYNPETKTNARKQTGSFYTPRAIVEYMVDESLKAYLKTKLMDSLPAGERAKPETETAVEEKLSSLVAYNEQEPQFSAKEKRFILEALDSCKILDPACGSGAFPMGILQKIVYIIHKLDPENRNWKTIQADKIEDNTALTKEEKKSLMDDMNVVFDDNELDYARKLYLIENCIHGIDIQPIATQISRLRFFISLIVDQTVDRGKPNFGVRPLPNLENRFVTANSLIGLNDETATLFDADIAPLMERLQKVRHDLFSARTPKYKFELRQQDKQIRAELEETLVKLGFGKENARLISTWDPYDKNKSAEFFDAEWMFGVKDGFDVVIGNPPYLRVQGLRANYEKESKIYEQKFKCATGRFDFYVLFIEMGYTILKKNGILSYILPHKFINSDFGKGIRKFIYDNKALRYLVHFGEEQVFGKASVYTCIIGLSYGNKEFKFAQVNPKEIENGIQFVKIAEEILANIDKWNISFSEDNKILDKLNLMPYRIKDVFKGIYQGIVSGDNKAFYLEDCNETENYIEGYSAAIESRIKIEKEICKPIFTGKTISRYKLLNKNEQIIYPYHLVDNKSIFYTEKELKEQYPKCYEYFSSIKQRLTSRGSASMKYPIWYALWNPRNIQNLTEKKIFTPDICYGSSMVYDEVGYFHNDTSYGLVLKNPNEQLYKAYLAILNSSITWYFLQKTGTSLRGGYFRFKTKYLEPFSLPDLDEQTIQKLVYLVDKILAAKKADSTADTSKFEAEIDRLVYALYGLTEDEIKIVEGR